MKSQRRLELLFAQALLATGCNSSTPVAPADATTSGDAEAGASPTDAAMEADAFDACTPIQRMIDAGPPAEGGVECSWFFEFGCGLPSDIVPRQSCYFSIPDCEKMCPDPQFNCHAYGSWCEDGGITKDAGPQIVECVWCPGGVGRRPRGLVLDRPRASASAYGEWLARAAHLEAASVRAFRAMRQELANAPARLVFATRKAERDERRHARVMGRLARANGAEPMRVRVRKSRTSFAIENLVEGCVRETYGALVARFQAENASDPELRAALRDIARDETCHAALAWDTAAWTRRRATPLERTRMDRALRHAIREAAREAAHPIDPDLGRRAGLPDPKKARALFAALEPLWAAR